MTQLKFCTVLVRFIGPLNKSIKQSGISFHQRSEVFITHKCLGPDNHKVCSLYHVYLLR